MDDAIATKELTVSIQENGIIRAPNGRLIARLVDDIKFDSEHLEQSPETGQVNAVVSVPDDVKDFLRSVTLGLQHHRSKSEKDLDKLFQDCYKMYVKYRADKAH